MLEARLQESAKRHPGLRHRVVEISRLPTPNDCLVKLYPGASFVNYLFPSDIRDFNPPVDGTIYHLHGALWNYPDEECVTIIRVLAGILEKSPAAVVLVNDLMSPQPGTAPENHPDKIYRRRDVTVMTMHNAKIRTAQEWHALFLEAHPDIKVSQEPVDENIANLFHSGAVAQGTALMLVGECGKSSWPAAMKTTMPML